MKLIIGVALQPLGTVEYRPDGRLVLRGNQTFLLETIRDWRGRLPNEEFVRTLPDRLRSVIWAQPEDDYLGEDFTAIEGATDPIVIE